MEHPTRHAGVLTRGIRNHNPGNIERTRTRWLGMARTQDDPRFVVFTAPRWGIRAMARVLHTYYHKHGLRTVRGIMSRWAPGHENDTRAYTRHVAGELGVSPDDRISWDRLTIHRLVASIILHENGAQPYPDSTIRRALRLAGLKEATNEVLSARP